ncbi:divergent polysaccharide deacetylase family protein [Paenibacillus beijingensis]|uniref:divergent polysaccharide deacetylase family protein n=1 Tax=Paenibacillus beijingensis TaxID=1126833 RepID=UPI003B75C0A8
MKSWKAGLLALLLLAAAGVRPFAAAAEPDAVGNEPANPVINGRVAVVIDDLGNAMDGTEQMLQLPIKLTVAVMPFMQTTKADAEHAHKLGRDVIVHMPMEPNRGKAKWLGPGAITADMSDEEVRKRVEQAIDDVPYAIGMNNHMGSKVTVNERIMRVVLMVCRERGLFFLDSRTAYKSVIPKIGRQVGVPVIGNDVFLDDVYSAGHVAGQIRVLQKFLESHRDAVTIGHVGPPGKITSAVLLRSIPAMKRHTEFVRLSELLP